MNPNLPIDQQLIDDVENDEHLDTIISTAEEAGLAYFNQKDEEGRPKFTGTNIAWKKFEELCFDRGIEY